MVERLRAARVVVPAGSALERVALIARAQARRAVYSGLIRDCAPEQETRLERLTDASEEGRAGLDMRLAGSAVRGQPEGAGRALGAGALARDRA
jgi:hypothetical protein